MLPSPFNFCHNYSTFLSILDPVAVHRLVLWKKKKKKIETNRYFHLIFPVNQMLTSQFNWIFSVDQVPTDQFYGQHPVNYTKQGRSRPGWCHLLGNQPEIFAPVLWMPTNNYVFSGHQYITGDSHHMYCDNSAKDWRGAKTDYVAWTLSLGVDSRTIWM